MSVPSTKQRISSLSNVRTYTCFVCEDSYTEAIPITETTTADAPFSNITNSSSVKSSLF